MKQVASLKIKSPYRKWHDTKVKHDLLELDRLLEVLRNRPWKHTMKWATGISSYFRILNPHNSRKFNHKPQVYLHTHTHSHTHTDTFIHSRHLSNFIRAAAPSCQPFSATPAVPPTTVQPTATGSWEAAARPCGNDRLSKYCMCKVLIKSILI